MHAERNVSISLERAGHGWANCTLSFGAQQFTLDWISTTTDALGDLVRAALKIATGTAEARVSFDREPVEWRVLLSQHQGRLRVRVLDFPDIYAEAPNELGQERFLADCDPEAFARAVAAEAKALLERAQQDGQTDWLDVPDPFPDLAALKAALASPASPEGG